MHGLINISPISDTGTRKDFGAETPPDMTRKGIKWVPIIPRGVRPPPSDPLNYEVKRGPDTVTITEITESWQEVELNTERKHRVKLVDRRSRLEPDIQPIFDKMRPLVVSPPGSGVRFDDLTPAERTKLMRYIGLSNGFDA